MKQRVVMIIVMLAVPSVQAAGFDCSKASLPVEKALCLDKTLSQSDDQMNDAYKYLLAQCRDVATRADLSGTQRRWLAGIRKDFGEISPEALDALNAAYRARNAALAKLLAECNPEAGPARATVTMVKDTANGYMLPFIQTTPPLPGWRINKILLGGYGGRPPLDIGELNDFFAKHKPVDQLSGIPTSFTVVSNKGNLLVMHVSGTDCEPDAPRCSPYDTQYRFDIRTGRVVQTDELYTEQGAGLLAQKLEEKLLGLARSRIAALSQADAEAHGEQYRQCLDSWMKYGKVGVEAAFTADGRMQFGLGNCSSYSPYGPDPEQAEGTALDNLTLVVAVPELRSYLSAYGKSLLLGEGDVPEPIVETPQACPLHGGLAVRKDDGTAAQGLQASAGEDHFLLLTKEGRLWGWGESHYGELGSANGRVPVATLQQGDYAQVGGGQSYTAALARDGSLWTWGSNYQNRLGNGTDKSSEHPVRIGEGFVSLKVESYGAMALKRDGTVWGWGGTAKTPQRLMADVRHIEYGPAGERLMLKRDGSLWALGGFSYPGETPQDATQPRRVGDGFTRLAVRHGDLAYKADGSLWAWSGVLANSFRLDGGDEQSYQQPANIGSGFINVKVAGNHGRNLTALKADGSLWMAKTRGTVTRLTPVGCGYADMVMGEEYLLTLKQDGSLEVWGNWAERARNEQRPRAQKENAGQPALPGYSNYLLLGKGYTGLFAVGDLWGSLGAKAVVLKNDGGVWLFRPPWPRNESGPRDWFTQVPFPKEANLGK